MLKQDGDFLLTAKGFEGSVLKSFEGLKVVVYGFLLNV